MMEMKQTIDYRLSTIDRPKIKNTKTSKNYLFFSFLKSIVYSLLSIVVFLHGCGPKGNVGQLQSYGTLNEEPLWIRNGEPIIYEEEMWYPIDGVESLLDQEVQVLGEYQGVQFFVEKIDVRPLNRLYTKFSRNKFRIFEKNKNSTKAI